MSGRSPLGDVEEGHEGSSCPDCGRRPGWHDFGEDAGVVRHRMHAGGEKSINDPPPEDGYYKLTQHGIVSKARGVETTARGRRSRGKQFRRIVDHVPFRTRTPPVSLSERRASEGDHSRAQRRLAAGRTGNAGFPG